MYSCEYFKPLSTVDCVRPAKTELHSICMLRMSFLAATVHQVSKTKTHPAGPTQLAHLSPHHTLPQMEGSHAEMVADMLAKAAATAVVGDDGILRSKIGELVPEQCC